MSQRPPPPIRRTGPRRMHEARFTEDTAREHPADRSGVVARPTDFEHFVRVDKHGRVLTGHGQVEQLAALTAYVTRMADLIGEMLQFGPTVAVEATLAKGAFFVYRDGGGELVGAKPQARMSLRQLRTRLNL
jgi:hypothetical protein